MIKGLAAFWFALCVSAAPDTNVITASGRLGTNRIGVNLRNEGSGLRVELTVRVRGLDHSWDWSQIHVWALGQGGRFLTNKVASPSSLGGVGMGGWMSLHHEVSFEKCALSNLVAIFIERQGSIATLDAKTRSFDLKTFPDGVFNVELPWAENTTMTLRVSQGEAEVIGSNHHELIGLKGRFSARHDNAYQLVYLVYLGRRGPDSGETWYVMDDGNFNVRELPDGGRSGKAVPVRGN
jgi:hypothetical protein